MPSRALRFMLFGFLGFIGLVSLADRAPGRIDRWLDAGQRLGSRGEQRLGIDLIDRGDIPFASETVGHLVLWAVATLLACGAFGRLSRLPVIAISLFALSAALEVGQGLLSSTRNPQVHDLVANTVGIAVGLAVAVSAWALAGLFGRLTRSLSV